MKVEYIPFRRDRNGEGVWDNVCWMRTSPADGPLPPRLNGNRCHYCKGPLACEPLPHGTLLGVVIVRCDPCDVWMNYDVN